MNVKVAPGSMSGHKGLKSSQVVSTRARCARSHMAVRAAALVLARARRGGTSVNEWGF